MTKRALKPFEQKYSKIRTPENGTVRFNSADIIGVANRLRGSGMSLLAAAWLCQISFAGACFFFYDSQIVRMGHDKRSSIILASCKTAINTPNVIGYCFVGDMCEK